ncbi:MAG: hypothetical protein Kow00121_47530 [Elainellaceae cyanobacterium]
MHALNNSFSIPFAFQVLVCISVSDDTDLVFPVVLALEAFSRLKGGNSLKGLEVEENTPVKISEQMNSSKNLPFGQSLHIDLYEIDKEICDDLSFCYRLLDELADFLDMHKQSPPFIFRSPDKQFPEKAGLSGWVPLIESGISIHTLTMTGFVSIDIYTCGDLNIQKTIQYLCDLLGTQTYEHQYLVRGVNYHNC